MRDSGPLHTLLSIGAENQLQTHNKQGALWEGAALECVLQSLGGSPARFFFWATHAGAELDFFRQSRGKNWGTESLFLCHYWSTWANFSYRLSPVHKSVR